MMALRQRRPDKRSLGTLIAEIALVAAVPCVSAQTNAPPGTNTPALPTSEVDTAAAAVAVPRDPFWPVGYTPKPPEQERPDEEAEPIEIPDEWPTLNVSGVTRAADGTYIAIVERIGLVEQGEAVSLTVDGLVYRWRVNRVTGRGVSFSKLDVKPVRR